MVTSIPGSDNVVVTIIPGSDNVVVARIQGSDNVVVMRIQGSDNVVVTTHNQWASLHKLCLSSAETVQEYTNTCCGDLLHYCYLNLFTQLFPPPIVYCLMFFNECVSSRVNNVCYV